MKTSTKIGLGASALLVAGIVAGANGGYMAAAFAGSQEEMALLKAASRHARDAEKALEKRDYADAVEAAEQAVGAAPQDAGYRALLGQSYLSSGRFLSAKQALADAITLDPSNGRAALNLALAQIALGDWQTARETLAAHAAHIDTADRGLALALAGDPMGGVAVLGEAAREPTSGAKVRQNLALSLALAGRWNEAKTIAAIDLPPAEVDKRIMQWASFARPGSASEQVASLLGVTPIADGGQPVRLALQAPAEQMAAVAQPAAPAEANLPAPAEIVEAPTVAVAVEAAPPPQPRIIFAQRREIVQALPVRASASVRAAEPARTPAAVPAAKSAASAPRAFTPASGSYYVQLGAFENAAVARDAWGRLSRRVAALADQTPQGMQASSGGEHFYRLSVGGYARGDADRLCRNVRARGGKCFVRQHAGEKVASWSRGEQYAHR